jgi:hypothetical protein
MNAKAFKKQVWVLRRHATFAGKLPAFRLICAPKYKI